MTVEGSRGKAVPGESELQCGDVPAANAEDDRPAPERRALAVTAECGARLRAGYSVGGETGLRLEPLDRAHRSGTEHAVDGPGVETTPPQPQLERGSIRLPGREDRPGEG